MQDDHPVISIIDTHDLALLAEAGRGLLQLMDSVPTLTFQSWPALEAAIANAESVVTAVAGPQLEPDDTAGDSIHDDPPAT